MKRFAVLCCGLLAVLGLASAAPSPQAASRATSAATAPADSAGWQ